jgi:hypothetical protein
VFRYRVRNCAVGLLIAAAVQSTGCAVANRISGVSETRAIQAIGVPAQATVLQIWDTGITYNNDPVISLRLLVDRPGYATYDAVINKSLVSRVHVAQFQPGALVPVRVDPNNPARVALDVYRY